MAHRSAPVTEEALRRIYGETFNALYAYASRRCGGQRELAEDVTQETWLRAVREWPSSGLPDNPLGWLTTVARNLILNHYRRKVSESIDDVSPLDVLEAVERDTVSDRAE